MCVIGNGRLVRLLANRVLYSVMPFPVAVHRDSAVNDPTLPGVLPPTHDGVRAFLAKHNKPYSYYLYCHAIEIDRCNIKKPKPLQITSMIISEALLQMYGFDSEVASTPDRLHIGTVSVGTPYTDEELKAEYAKLDHKRRWDLDLRIPEVCHPCIIMPPSFSHHSSFINSYQIMESTNNSFIPSFSRVSCPILVCRHVCVAHP